METEGTIVEYWLWQLLYHAKKRFESCYNITGSDESSPRRKRAHALEKSKRSEGTGVGKRDVHKNYTYLNYCTVVLEWLQFRKMWIMMTEQHLN